MRYDYERKLYLDFDSLWGGTDDDLCLILLLSSRDISILLNAIRYAGYSSRWLDSDGRLLRDTGRMADLAIALNYIEQLERRILGVACLEDLTNAIIAQGEAIKAGLVAIAHKPCCSDSVNINIVQGATPGGEIQYGEQPGLAQGDSETDPPPDGFETWEAYYTHKCQVANHLADGLILSLRNIGLLNLGNLVSAAALLGAALGGFILLPPAAIPVLIAAVVALGISQAILYEIGDWLQDNRDELVCGLYNSESAGAATDFFAGMIDEALAALAVASSLHPAIRTIALVLASTDTLNQLFDASLSATYPDADCSGCDDIDGVEIVFGEGSGTDNTLISGEMIAPSTGYNTIVVSGKLDAAGIAFNLQAADYTTTPQISGTCFRSRVVSATGGTYVNVDGRLCDTQYATGINPDSNMNWITWNMRRAGSVGTTVTATIRITADTGLDLTL